MSNYKTLICRLEYTEEFDVDAFKRDIETLFADYYRRNPKGIWSYGLKIDDFPCENDDGYRFMEVWMRDLYGGRSPERLQNAIEDLLSETKSVVYLSFSEGF